MFSSLNCHKSEFILSDGWSAKIQFYLLLLDVSLYMLGQKDHGELGAFEADKIIIFK